jgi:hypothetical protein
MKDYLKKRKVIRHDMTMEAATKGESKKEILIQTSKSKLFYRLTSRAWNDRSVCQQTKPVKSGIHGGWDI